MKNAARVEIAVSFIRHRKRRNVTAAGLCRVLLFIVFSCSHLAAQELFFTYAGPILSAGFTSVNYSDWDGTRRVDLSESGYAFSGGGVLDIMARSMIGEFSLQFMNNMGGDTAVVHLLYSATGKYRYSFNPDFFMAAGLGIYYESGPATKEFDGGGGIAATAGIGYLVAHDWYLITDLTARYGSFGMGDRNTRDFLFLKVPESTKLYLGISIAVIYKVGRL